EHRTRGALGLIRRLRELDAAALPAAACVNLRFDNDDAGAQTLGDVEDFCRVGGFLASRNWHAVMRKDGFGLILVDFHDVSKRKMLIAFCLARQPAAI